MGKRKKRNYETVCVDIPNKGTILERFHGYLKNHKKKSDIITFLSAINAECLTYGGNLSAEKTEEIIEFAMYFDENFYELMYDDMMDNWGQDPYILRLAAHIMEQLYKEERKQYIKSVPLQVQKEAKTLADTLFAIREYRRFTFTFEAMEDGITNGTFELPKTLYKEELADAREELLFVCTEVIQNRGAITVRLIKKDHHEVFGIRVLPIGIWSPVSKEEMKRASLITPDGIELEPEENVIYTEIQRNQF